MRSRYASKLTEQQRREMTALYRDTCLTVGEIADRFGVTQASVCSTARRRGVPMRNRTSVGNVTTSLAFRAEADRRGITPGALARMVLAVVAKDNMFAAILDD